MRSERYKQWIARHGLSVVVEARTTCTKCGRWLTPGTQVRWWPREYLAADAPYGRRECLTCAPPV